MHKMSIISLLRKAMTVAIAVCVVQLPAAAEVKAYLPIASSDQQTLRAQRLVEELYESKQYKRSRIIYEKELAPIGDKYAQYMVGFMLLNGQGSAINRPAALAWYRLAAERKEPLILQARDSLFASMTQVEIVLSNEIFVELWREIGDNRLILDLVQRDLDTLRAKTGSRLAGSSTSPITIVNMRTNEVHSEASYARIQKRIELRLEYLDANVEIVDVDLNDEFAVKKSLESEIRKEMAALDMR